MEQMQYGELRYVNRPVSRLIFGTAMPAMLKGENVDHLLDAVTAAGVNCFDTARVYGDAEHSLGDWMTRRGNRNELVLIGKGAHPAMGSTSPRVTPECIREDLKTSLTQLQTDHMDVYLLHRDDKTKPVGPIVEVLNDLHEAGKIGAFGVSNWCMERFDAANEYAYSHDMTEFSVSSPAFGLAEQVEDPWGGGCISIAGRKNASVRRWYEENGVSILAYASLAHGFFSGKLRASEEQNASKVLDQFALKGYLYPENLQRLARAEELANTRGITVSQVALAWVLEQPMKPWAMFSASSIPRLMENLGCLNIRLSEKELKYLNLE